MVQSAPDSSCIYRKRKKGKNNFYRDRTRTGDIRLENRGLDHCTITPRLNNHKYTDGRPNNFPFGQFQPSIHIARDLPCGAGGPDSSEHTGRARLDIRISTLNTRTLKSSWRLEEAGALMNDLNLDALAVQEHRHHFDEPSREKELGAGIIMTQAPADAHGVGGVALILSRRLSADAKVTVVNSRIMTASINLRRRRLHLVCAYAPTAPKTFANPLETISFYNQLQSLVDSFPLRDVTVLLGDMNATLAERTQRVLFPVGHANGNSEHFTNFLDRCDMTPLNANFKQKPNRRITFDGMRGRKTRLDYICCSTPSRRHFVNCRSVRMLTIKSDHRLVVATLRERLPFVPKRVHTDSRPNWLDLQNKKTNHEFASYACHVLDAGDSQPLSFASLTKAINESARNILSVAKRTQRQKSVWEIDPVVLRAREDLKTLRRAAFCSGSSIIHTDANAASLRLSTAYNDARLAHIEALAITVENEMDANRPRAAWKAIADLTGNTKKARVTASKDDLAKHFQMLLSIAPPDNEVLIVPPSLPTNSLAINTGTITLNELRMAMHGAHFFKSAGTDGIPLAAYTSGIQLHLLEVMNNTLRSGTAPSEWLESEIVPIFKKGLATDPSNYRGISLMQTAAKLFDRVLLFRIRDPLSQKLLNAQNGFRSNRGTTEHILALRIVIDACRSRKKNLFVVFVDFAKAFDSVSRRAMAQILGLYGVPDVIAQAIMAMYSCTRARVRTDKGKSDIFETTAGVLQGDTLAPFLFVMVLDYVLRTAFPNAQNFFEWRPRQGTRTRTTCEPITVGILAFADDIALLASTESAAQSLLDQLVSAAALVGLVINTKKTEVLTIPAASSDIVTQIRIGDTRLKNIVNFTYLGIDVTDSKRALRARRAKAWGAARRLNALFTSDATPQLKIRIFRATVEQIFLYGVETLTISPTLQKTLNANYDALLRYGLGFRYPDNISCDYLRRLSGTPQAHVLATERRLRLVGHLVRHHDEQPAAAILEHIPTEEWRPGGWNRKTWRALLERDLENRGLSLEDAWDRPRWRRMIKHVS